MTSARGIRVKPVIAWYDVWVGMFWDQQKRRLYVFPVPCIGFVVSMEADDAAA